MSTLAMIAGGILGVLLRTLLEGPLTTEPPRWRSLTIGVLGAAVLGALTGAGVTGGQPALGVGLSGALLTFCLDGAATRRLLDHDRPHGAVAVALAGVLSAFVAATAGVVLGVNLAA